MRIFKTIHNAQPVEPGFDIEQKSILQYKKIVARRAHQNKFPSYDFRKFHLQTVRL